jgi:beta-lactam-binding protein with PASTA domain
LRRERWSWPAPSSVAGVAVPDVRGLTLPAAKNRLAAAGFRMQQLDATNGLSCASSISTGDVAFYGPKRAPQGSTVTVCPSSGAAQDVYVPPPPPPPTYYPPPTSEAPPPPPTSTSSAAQPTQPPQPTHSAPPPKPKPSSSKPKPHVKPKPSKSKPRH